MNAFALPVDQQIGLAANLPRLKAKRKIEAGDFSGMTHRHIYRLYLDAYGDEELARRAQSAFLEAEVKRTCDAALG